MTKVTRRLEFDSVEDAQAFMNNLRVGATPPEAEQEKVLAELPSVDREAPIMVSRSIRWPVELEQAVKAAAAAEGVTASEWVRRAAQRVLAGASSSTISLDDAIAALRELPHTA